MSVSEPSEVPRQEAFVEVRFAGTSDYKIVPGKKEQKFVLAWILRLHRGMRGLYLIELLRTL